MGRSDSALTRSGMEVTIGLGSILNEFRLDRIISSPLPRAFRTASYFGHVLKTDIIKDNRLSELSCGDWEGLDRSLVLGPDNLIRKDWESSPPNGESYKDGESRLAPLLGELWEQERAGIPLMVVSHASIGRVFLKLLLGLETQQAMTLALPHNTLFIAESGNLIKTVDHTGAVGGSLIWQAPKIKSRSLR